MKPEIFLNGRVTLWCGDVRAVLAGLPADHFDCVVTSPPYWGLRDYGVEGQLGLERSLGEHLAVMVDVFREVHRVLKPSGTVWLNYGDCYATSPNGRSAADTKAVGNDDRTFRDKPFSTIGAIYDPDGGSKGGGSRRGKSGNKGNGGPDENIPRGRIVAPGPTLNRERTNVRQTKHPNGTEPRARVEAGGYLKPKDLCMIPNRLAIALQDDGWWVRSEIVWGKRNGMPDSSGKYRPSTAHEKIFMLSKTANCFYDAEAVAMPCSDATNARVSQDVANQIGSARANGGTKTNGNMKAVTRKSWKGSKFDGPRDLTRHPDTGRKRAEVGSGIKNNDSMDAALAIMPETRYLRNYEPAPLEVWPMATNAFSEAHFATFPPELVERALRAGCPSGGSVLDPFGGSGTVGMVAAARCLRATLIELNPEYCTLARARIEAAFMGKEEGARHMVRQLGKSADAGPLFGGT